MSPRRIAQCRNVDGVMLELADRVLFMFGSANRGVASFDDPDRFHLGRDDSSPHIAFGACPHGCAKAAASKAPIAEVALSAVFNRLAGLRLAPAAEGRFGG